MGEHGVIAIIAGRPMRRQHENAFQINGLLLNDNLFDAILSTMIICTMLWHGISERLFLSAFSRRHGAINDGD